MPTSAADYRRLATPGQPYWVANRFLEALAHRDITRARRHVSDAYPGPPLADLANERRDLLDGVLDGRLAGIPPRPAGVKATDVGWVLLDAPLTEPKDVPPTEADLVLRLELGRGGWRVARITRLRPRPTPV